MFGSLAITDGRIDSFDFRLSSGELSANAIFDSATCPPGRYVLEVARRTLAAVPNCNTLVIGNPILPMTGSTLADLVLTKGSLPVPCVVTDQERFPVAYVIPRSVFDDGLGKFLNLLSVTSRLADAVLLEHLTGQEVASRQSSLKAVEPLPLTSPQGFVFHQNSDAWLLQCSNAVALMSSRTDWRRLPLAMHMPFHAGDVAFFCLASRLNRHNDYDRHIVCRDYKDVFRDCGSTLEPIFLDQPPAPHTGAVGGPRYFIQSLPVLGEAVQRENFIVYGRPSKSYNLTPFNLIDHARFALGEALTAFEDTLYAKPPLATNRCPRPVAPLRVLMQLNGGWQLKVYPSDDRAVLIRALRVLGCEVTVIDMKEAAIDGAQVVKAGSTGRLAALLNDHHVFVSVDTFPLHFASHVVGHPTVALFGSTAPNNSDAPRRPGYRLPMPFMPCAPCGKLDYCVLTKSGGCSNYPRPNQIIAAIFELADEIYGTALEEMMA